MSPTLVIQTAFLGDVVLTLPLLHRLAEAHGPVDILTTPSARPLVAAHPAVREAIAYDKRGRDRGLGGLLGIGRALRARRYARVYLPHRSWRSATLALLAGAPERIGFHDSPAAWSYTRRMRRGPGHETVRLLRLAGTGLSLPPVPWLAIAPADTARAEAWLEQRGVTRPFLVLAPGSAWGTKRWGGFAALAERGSVPMVVVGGSEDALLGEAIAAAAPGRAHNAAGVLSLGEAAAVIGRARALVTNDSAPLHLATAVGTPVVAVFGPTVPEFGFGPLGPQARVVQHRGLDCRPCSSHGPPVCPLNHHRCMRDISVTAVEEAVEQCVR